MTAPCIDGFCSSSLWTIPARDAFHADHEIHTWSDGDGYVALASGRSDQAGPYLMPIEAVWGLGCPIVHPVPHRGARCLAAALQDSKPWQVALLTGLRAESELFHLLAATLTVRRYKLRPTPPTVRHVASLEGGVDGYLSRRRRKFRAGLRRTQRGATERGVALEAHTLTRGTDVQKHWSRILDVERQSWKSIEGNGVAEGPMAQFAPDVLRRSADRDRALILFATHEGRDIGYLHGALVDGYFRGLQMSFVDDWRPHGIGNLMQFSTIKWLCEDGAHTYDLGGALPYKERWAEQAIETLGLVVSR